MKNIVKSTSVIMLIAVAGCSGTQELYHETPLPTRPALEQTNTGQIFESSTVTYAADASRERQSILSESLNGDSPEIYLQKLSIKGVDVSVVDHPVINFNFDSSTLSEDSKSLIKKHATLLNSSSNLKVILEGHTDSQGDRSYNLKLGERRALAVKDYAVLLGVNPSQIEVISYGEERLLNKEQNNSEKLLNRRAEFVYK